MGLFVESSEDDGKQIVRFKLAALYYWLMWPAVLLTILYLTGYQFPFDASNFEDVNLYFSSAVWAVVIALGAPYWSWASKIKKAAKAGSVKVSGSKYSFSNPPTYEIEKTKGP